MQSTDRRNRIADILSQSDKPISATKLASKFDVSRQIIVGDIALLRASGIDIDATPRGYMMKTDDHEGYTGTIACRHSSDAMHDELYTIVDLGGRVLDVIVDHAIYGQLTGRLELASRYDVDQFVRKVDRENAQPLSRITDGVHLHTVNCADKTIFDRIIEALQEKGYLYD